jgi:hypothetical protein
MSEEQFIKRLKSYLYVWELLTEKHDDLPSWVYRQFKNELNEKNL